MGFEPAIRGLGKTASFPQSESLDWEGRETSPANGGGIGGKTLGSLLWSERERATVHILPPRFFNCIRQDLEGKGDDLVVSHLLEVAPRSSMERKRGKQIFVTAAALIVYEALRYIPLIGIARQDYLRLANEGTLFRSFIFSLGLQPYIDANLILMLLLAVPWIKKRLVGDGQDFARLNQIILGVTLVLAVLNTWPKALLLYYAPSYSQRAPIELTRALFVPLTILTQTAAVFLLVWLGTLITKYGIGHGFSLVFLLPHAEGAVRGLKDALLSIEKTHVDRVPVAFSFGLIIAFIWFMVFLLNKAKEIKVRKIEDDQPETSIQVPLSLAGYLPLVLTTAISKFLSQLAALSKSQTDSFFVQISALLHFHPFVPGIVLYSVIVLFFTYFTLGVIDLEGWSKRLTEVGLVWSNEATARRVVLQVWMSWAAFLVSLTLVCGLVPIGFNISRSPITQQELFFITGIVWVIWQSWKNTGYTKEVYRHHSVGKVYTAPL